MWLFLWWWWGWGGGGKGAGGYITYFVLLYQVFRKHVFFIFMSIYSNIKKIVYIIEFGDKLLNYLQNQLRKVYEFDKN